MKKKLLLMLSIFAVLSSMSVVGHAADDSSWGCSVPATGFNQCTISDNGAQTIEPILTRSSAAPIYADCGTHTGCTKENFPTNGLANQSANIKSLTVKVGGGRIIATVKVNKPFVRSLGAMTDTSANKGMLPYSGQHVLVMFQTELFQENQQTGTDPAGQPLTWGPPGYNADGFRWWLGYGWNSSENRDICGVGYYDPTGELVPPAPVFFGQTFFSVGQKSSINVQQPNTTCTFPDAQTVVINQPYRYTYSDNSGQIPLSVLLVDPTSPAKRTLSNVSAFSWLDHEIGGPDPVGLILGWTWYTDSLPIAGYAYGVVAGDPNPFAFAGPKCYTNVIGGDPVTGPPGPCLVKNTAGPGFQDDHFNITATS